MKYYTMSRFVMLIAAVIVLTGYHIIEMQHGIDTTREYTRYGPGH